MLTKSLHTITAATNVARYLAGQIPAQSYSYTRSDVPVAGRAALLAADALRLLGHAAADGDATYERIVKACAAILTARTVKAAA